MINEPQASPHDPIVMPGRNAWRVEKAEALAFLVDGDEYFRALDEALRTARRSVRIVGWDFDPDIRLRPQADGETLGDLLRSLADDTPQLHIHILVWSMGPIYSGRSFKLFRKKRWRDHPRVHLQFDSHHALMGSHHQKLVTIDEDLAFVGGTYYPRFLARFPDVQSLAVGHIDDVLALWSGLGYYSRARNLYACACAVVAQHGGAFPRTAEVLQTLPGIGRSTAAAIASFCFGERVAILDANVKRVLTRVLGFSDDLAVAAHERVLWSLATELLPHEALDTTMPRYTQGLMDIGATVCLPRKPVCLVCPLHAMCVARRVGNPELYPVKTRKLKRSAESWWLLLARDTQGRVWLQRRPAKGIWAGLYCLPVFADRAALEAVVPPRALAALQDGAPFLHVLTHKDLHLHPVQWVAGGANAPATEGAWVAADKVLDMGLPAPVRKLLEAELARGLQPA